MCGRQCWKVNTEVYNIIKTSKNAKMRSCFSTNICHWHMAYRTLINWLGFHTKLSLTLDESIDTDHVPFKVLTFCEQGNHIRGSPKMMGDWDGSPERSTYSWDWESLGMVPGTPVVEGENWLMRMVLWPPHAPAPAAAHAHMHISCIWCGTHTHTHAPAAAQAHTHITCTKQANSK